jgi:hypothetical protein
MPRIIHTKMPCVKFFTVTKDSSEWTAVQARRTLSASILIYSASIGPTTVTLEIFDDYSTVFALGMLSCSWDLVKLLIQSIASCVLND